MERAEKEAFAQSMGAFVARSIEAATAPLLTRLAEMETKLAMVNDAVSALPTPKDGVGVAGAMIDRAGLLILTLSDGTARELGVVIGKDGEPGRDGRDGADGINGEPGKPGENGKDADQTDIVARSIAIVQEDLAAQLPDLVGRAVAALPPPRDGIDGKDGSPGRDGIDGKDGADGAAGRDGKDGADGLSGRDGADGVQGKDGAPGERGTDGLNGKDGSPGSDGVGIAGALIDREGSLIVTLSDGTQRSLGLVVGSDGGAGPAGRDGADGADGFGLDDFDTEMKDDGRTILLKFMRGDVCETHEFVFPTAIYRGVYVNDGAYQPGDMVTWAGSLYHCNVATRDKPGESSRFWTLAVKRGRDGKDVAV